jgi:hypothetical protein
MVGHGTIRHLAMDPEEPDSRGDAGRNREDEEASSAEELKAGPFGLSSGLNMIRAFCDDGRGH